MMMMKSLLAVALLAGVTFAAQGDWDKNQVTYHDVKTNCEGGSRFVSYEDGVFKNVDPQYTTTCLSYIDIYLGENKVAQLHVTTAMTCDISCTTKIDQSTTNNEDDGVEAQAIAATKLSEFNIKIIQEYIEANKNTKFIKTVNDVMAETKKKGVAAHQHITDPQG